jgi:hypothetical protein
MRDRLAVLVAVCLSLLASAAPARAARLTPSERTQINAVVDRFVVQGVKRQDLKAAWSLVTPTLRSGTTRREWNHGSLPFYPYPARGRTFHDWQLAWVKRNDVGLDLTLQPVWRERKRIGPIAFGMELRRVHGRWLVDGFYVEATFAPVGAKPAVTSFPDFVGKSGDTGQPLLSSTWIVVGVGVLLLGPLAAIVAWLALAVKTRLNDGEIRRKRGTLPPLPSRIKERPTPGK